MTDNLLQKLEEKMMTLLAELENLRKETHHLRQENQLLKTEYGNHLEKLHNLVSLLDSLDSSLITQDRETAVDKIIEYAN